MGFDAWESLTDLPIHRPQRGPADFEPVLTVDVATGKIVVDRREELWGPKLRSRRVILGGQDGAQGEKGG